MVLCGLWPTVPRAQAREGDDVTITLRTDNGHYLRADLNLTVDATAHSVGPWEGWHAERQDDGRYALRSHHGTYLRADISGEVDLTAAGVGPWECWTVERCSEGGIALRSHHGRYLCAEAGGASVVYANRAKVGSWETFVSDLSAASPVVGRTGHVRLAGRAFVDDAGPWCALGSSYFPLVWLARHDLERGRKNLQWLAARGMDFVRAFADVGGPSWEDRTIDASDARWGQDVAIASDLAHTCGLRVAWTLFAGPFLAHAPSWYWSITAVFASAIGARLDSVQAVEVRNENQGLDDSTMRDCARILADLLPGVPVALCGTPEKELPDLYRGSAATLATVHWDREYGERGWRPVRQPWGYYDLQGMPVAHLNNEPIGIDSSIASESDPVKLAAAALTSWISGEAGYVLHHGAGVRAGGQADLTRGRKANVWEQPTLETALALITSARSLLPADLPNWDRHGHAWPSHPLDIHSAVGDAVEAGEPGCNRCYGATSGDRAVVLVAGIRDRFRASSKAGAFTVYRPVGAAWVSSGPTTSIDLAEEDSAIALLVRSGG